MAQDLFPFWRGEFRQYPESIAGRQTALLIANLNEARIPLCNGNVRDFRNIYFPSAPVSVVEAASLKGYAPIKAVAPGPSLFDFLYQSLRTPAPKEKAKK